MSYSPPKAWFYLKKRQALRRDGGTGDMPVLPEGSVYYVDLNGAYIIDNDGNYVIGAA
jgi:hypothetical protein